MTKNWKEKLKDLGIVPKEVRRTDGSLIDGWYTFEYKGLPVFTAISDNYRRVYHVGAPPFPPFYEEYKTDVEGGILECENFDYFMEHIEDFVKGTPGYERLVTKTF